MRILFAVTSVRPSYGGPALSVPRLAVALAEIGCTTAIWTADKYDAQLYEHLKQAGVITFDMPLRGAFEDFKPDLAHDNGVWLSHHHKMASLARSKNVCRVVSTRGMLEPWALKHKSVKKGIAWRVYQRRDLSTASALHATSQTEAENLRRMLPKHPIWMIPNGVDVPVAELPSDAPTTNRPRTAVFLGRIYPVKGLPMLVKAWAKERPTGWRLLIVGPDESGHQNEVEKLVTEANLAQVISFAGPLYGDAKTAALRDADLFVLPSHSESFGMAVAEALAHGLPVLTTTAVPWPLIDQNECGWRVAPTVDGLAAGLRTACAYDNKALRRMGAAGRRLVVEKFGWRQVADQFAAQYRQLTKDGRT